jgi:hypothetical protein
MPAEKFSRASGVLVTKSVHLPMAVGSKGNVYVAETDWDRRVQKFKPGEMTVPRVQDSERRHRA